MFQLVRALEAEGSLKVTVVDYRYKSVTNRMLYTMELDEECRSERQTGHRWS